MITPIRQSGDKKVERLRVSYRFLVEKETNGTIFTIDEIAKAAGWKPGTITTYLKKKWSNLVVVTAGGLQATGVRSYSEAEYVRLMSQRQDVSADPRKPDLRPEVESFVRKARESALLALQIYNNPTTVFRTEGFTVLMVLAWTALFHAIFEHRGTAYFYHGDDNKPLMVDGDNKAWELDKCMAEFWGGTQHASRKNLEFFIKLRNRVVHRFVPQIDPHVAGECQAFLLNFDELLSEHFGSYYAIRESLAVPLQTTTVRTHAQAAALRKLQGKHFDEVKSFVEAFRSDLAPSIYEDAKFSFRVFLVPKTGNHASSSDVSVEFVKYDPAHPDEMNELQRQIVAVREKQVTVSTPNLKRPNDVVTDVASRLGKPFKMHHHTLAWERYSVRPKIFDPSACDSRFCFADCLHKDYGYTDAWVEFLVTKLSDSVEYDALLATRRSISSTKVRASMA